MKGLYQEKIEFYKARFNTKEGIFELIFGSLVWGFLVVSYTEILHGKIFKILDFLPQFFQTWGAYLVFGIILAPLSIFLTYILTNIFKSFFINGRIIK